MRHRGGAGMRRVGLCTVRTLGQGAVTLRIPVLVAGDAVQLGLVAPQFRDVSIAQAIVREGAVEMPADIVHSALQLTDAEAVVRTLGETGGVFVGEEWMAIVGVDAVSFFGEPCLYRLRIRTN